MGREVNRLSAKFVDSVTAPGRYEDGNGLYIRVTPKQKSWTYLYRWDGKLTEAGLGSVENVGLAAARRKAADAHRQLQDGIKPGGREQAPAAPAAPKVPT